MKTSVRNSALALCGLLGLTVYILACTSFSPDDKSIVYPSVDPQSGQIGLAVFDRRSGDSEMLLVPWAFDVQQTNSTAFLLRAQFLDDGKAVLARCSVGSKDGARLFMLPWASKGAWRSFDLPELDDNAGGMSMAMATAGSKVFFSKGVGQVVRLDLKTGELSRHTNQIAGDVSLHPAGRTDLVFYTEEQSGKVEFGRMDALTFTRTPLVLITNDLAEGSLFAYDRTGTRVAFVSRDKHFMVLDKGGVLLKRPIASGEQEVFFAGGFFVPSGDKVLASFRRGPVSDKSTNVVYGIVEFPLNTTGPIRETVLITTPDTRDEMNVLFLQPGVSHDGKTLAVSSAYLAFAEPGLRPEDCALFLVDLANPGRNVTRIPIPMPKHRDALNL